MYGKGDAEADPEGVSPSSEMPPIHEDSVVGLKTFYLRNRRHQPNPSAAARRPVESRRAVRRACGANPDITPEMKRQILVERVARELFENLLFTDSDNPMVEDVRRTLAREFGEPLLFRYLAGESDLAVLRDTEDGPQEVGSEERIRILDRAWAVTLAQVDGTML